MPVDFTAATNGSNQLSVYGGTTGNLSGIIKNVYFQTGVSYTLSFDCVTSTGILVGATANGTTLIYDGITAPGGSHSYNFIGNGGSGWIGFAIGWF